MPNSYKVKIISPETKNKLMIEFHQEGVYERKANIHGTCVKLFTNNEQFKEMWEENFNPMPEDIRPHARIFCMGDGGKLNVLYEPLSKTVILKNCDYYGWLKSIALALVADFFEDFFSEHRRYSIHGSFIDYGNGGLGIIGPSGSGKTTLTYGLLLDKKCSFLTDDWFFVRLGKTNIPTYSAERNSYIRNDLAKAWPRFADKLTGIKLDNKDRAIVDVRRFFGSDRVKQESNLQTIVLLTRERSQVGLLVEQFPRTQSSVASRQLNKGKPPMKKLSAKEALEFMIKNDFCNPHQLVRSKKKLEMRKEFFQELFSRVPVYLLNTIETPKQSLERLKRLVEN
ncbi:MAG: hypothetical protein Q7S22_01025 [Candidatus Micrarchaeota archaeon]|nr:hypothetical protein [Candidatus Micrarchaeota archaeon]